MPLIVSLVRRSKFRQLSTMINTSVGLGRNFGDIFAFKQLCFLAETTTLLVFKVENAA